MFRTWLSGLLTTVFVVCTVAADPLPIADSGHVRRSQEAVFNPMIGIWTVETSFSTGSSLEASYAMTSSSAGPLTDIRRAVVEFDLTGVSGSEVDMANLRLDIDSFTPTFTEQVALNVGWYGGDGELTSDDYDKETASLFENTYASTNVPLAVVINVRDELQEAVDNNEDYFTVRVATGTTGMGDSTAMEFSEIRLNATIPDPPEPVGPGIDDIILDDETGELSITVPGGYSLEAVEAAELIGVDGDFEWEALVEGADYTVDVDVVTVDTDQDGEVFRMELIQDDP